MKKRGEYAESSPVWKYFIPVKGGDCFYKSTESIKNPLVNDPTLAAYNLSFVFATGITIFKGLEALIN